MGRKRKATHEDALEVRRLFAQQEEENRARIWQINLDKARKCFLGMDHVVLPSEWGASVFLMEQGGVTAKTIVIRLDCQHCPQGWEALSRALTQCTQLEHVHLEMWRRHVDDNWPNDLIPISILPHIPHLSKISMRPQWEPATWNLFAMHVSQCTHLTHLEINDVCIPGSALRTMGDWLASPDCLLVHLSMRSARINDEEAYLLAQTLHSNTSLRFLDLHNNHIETSGVEFALALDGNTTLTQLNLSNNMMPSSVAFAFAVALGANTTLTSLNLACNLFNDEGHAALVQSLHSNEALRKLNGYKSVHNFTLCNPRNVHMWRNQAKNWCEVLGTCTSSLEDALFINHEIAPYLYKETVRFAKLEM